MKASEKVRELGLSVGHECEIAFCTSWSKGTITAIGRDVVVVLHTYHDQELIVLAGQDIRRAEKPVTLEEAMGWIEAVNASRYGGKCLFDGFNFTTELLDRYRRVNLRDK